MFWRFKLEEASRLIHDQLTYRIKVVNASDETHIFTIQNTSKIVENLGMGEAYLCKKSNLCTSKSENFFTDLVWTTKGGLITDSFVPIFIDPYIQRFWITEFALFGVISGEPLFQSNIRFGANISNHETATKPWEN